MNTQSTSEEDGKGKAKVYVSTSSDEDEDSTEETRLEEEHLRQRFEVTRLPTVAATASSSSAQNHILSEITRRMSTLKQPIRRPPPTGAGYRPATGVGKIGVTEGRTATVKTFETIYQTPEFGIPADIYRRLHGEVQRYTTLKKQRRIGDPDDRSFSQLNEMEASLGTFYTIQGQTRFAPGLKSPYAFSRLLWHLDQLVGTNLKRRSINDVIRIIQAPAAGKDYQHLRQITSFGGDVEIVDIERKIAPQEYKLDVPQWGIRFSRAMEKAVPRTKGGLPIDFDGEWDRVKKMVQGKKDGRRRGVLLQRKRRRMSYESTTQIGEINTSPFRGLKIDITTVLETSYYNDGTKHTRKKYEVEAEVIDPNGYDLYRRDSKVPLQDDDNYILNILCQAIRRLIVWAQDVTEPDMIIDMQERTNVVAAHNALFAKTYPFHDKLQLNSAYWSKPRNIKLHNMLDKYFNPAITVKLNGVRGFVFVAQTGTYLCIPPFFVSRLGKGSDSYYGALLDCEYVILYENGDIIARQIHVIDILYEPELTRQNHLERNISDLDFTVRQKEAHVIVGAINEHDLILNMTTSAKIYFSTGDFYQRVHDTFEAIDALYEEYRDNNLDDPELEDGLIFQPPTRYIDPNIFKWKPPSHLTIDFQLKFITPAEMEEHDGMVPFDGSYFWLQVYQYPRRPSRHNPPRLVTFRGTVKNQYDGYTAIANESIGYILNLYGEEMVPPADFLDGEIVECCYDHKDEWFNIVRIRYDREKPNAQMAASDIWDDIKDPLDKKTIQGDSLALMRKYHNREKLRLLQKNFLPGSTILDIGSGRGGDIRKWQTAGLRKVYVVEPNADNLVELNRRSSGSKDSYKLLRDSSRHPNAPPEIVTLQTTAQNADFIRSHVRPSPHLRRRIKGADNQLHGIVAFFSFTFLMESREIFNGLLETLSMLPIGGKLVGIVLDGVRVEKELKLSRKVWEEHEDLVREEMDEGDSFKDQIRMYDIGRSHFAPPLPFQTIQDYIAEATEEEDLDATISSEDLEEDIEEDVTISSDEEVDLEEDLEEEEDLPGACTQEEEEDLNPRELCADPRNVFGIFQTRLFDVRDPFGNEVVTTICDRNTMVRNTREYLFRFNPFRKAVERLGFKLTKGYESYFLDGGSVFDRLSDPAKAFSALNRVFVFERISDGQGKKLLKPKVFTGENLEPDKSKTLPNQFGTKMSYIGTIRDTSNILHAVQRAISPEYIRSTRIERENFVREERGRVAASLDKQMFMEIDGGSYAAQYLHQNVQAQIDKKETVDPDAALEAAYRQFQLYLANPTEDLGEKTALQILSQMYGINIYILQSDILEPNQGKRYRIKYLYPSTQFSEQCYQTYSHSASIVLVTFDRFTFHVVGRKVRGRLETTFPSTDPFIEKIYQMVCPEGAEFIASPIRETEVKLKDISLMEVVSAGDLDQVKALLGEGEVNLQDHNGETALVLAVRKSISEGDVYQQIAQILLKDQSIDVNLQDVAGRTALMEAQTDAMTFLLMEDSDLGLQDNQGNTAYHRAVIAGGRIKTLARLGADPNVQNEEEQSVLTLAVDKGDVGMVREILDGLTPVNTNLQDKNGNTALMLAFGYPEIVKILLSIPGINVYIKNTRGQTIADLAKDDARVEPLIEAYLKTREVREVSKKSIYARGRRRRRRGGK